MSPKKFFAYFFLQWGLLTLVKVIHLNGHLLQGQFGFFSYLILTGVVAAAVVRRQGVMNYLEAGMVSVSWLVVDLFLDYILANQFLPSLIFSHIQVWIACGIIVLSIFFFVKIGNAGLVLAFIGILILFLLTDALFGSRLETTNFSYQTEIWVGYFIMMLSVIVFHKKRHIAIRRGEYQEHGHH